ncbi:MAG: hypothetical protein IJI45_14610 [Anaerolineaceae bacterium]|nr:hypothetical protein [Anaerolineaceae bacterium]
MCKCLIGWAFREIKSRIWVIGEVGLYVGDGFVQRRQPDDRKSDEIIRAFLVDKVVLIGLRDENGVTVFAVAGEGSECVVHGKVSFLAGGCF